MKLPNGYGSIVKLTGKRRKPYLVRTACKYSDDGEKMIEKRQVLGYYATKAEALAALADYNSDPYDLAAHSLTFAEVSQKCFEDCKLADNTKRSYISALNCIKPIETMEFTAIKLTHLQAITNEQKPTMQKVFKNALKLIYSYAIRHEITDKDYASMIETDVHTPTKEKSIFTSDEINKLWEMSDNYMIGNLLILLYSGWRIEELLQMRECDIDLTAGTMKGGLKTEAGKNRIVPIHHRILPLIQSRITGSEYLIEHKNKPMQYATWQWFLKEINAMLEMSHTTHETRHTFVSLLNEKGAKKICIQKLIGHSGDVTDTVYTHIPIEELTVTIELLD